VSAWRELASAGVKRHRLGSWDCPTGNNVVGYITTHALDVGEIRMAWDSPPPLSTSDYAYYTATILPAVIALAAEYLERPCRRALVVTL
jgi:hypothetical protein